jgi:hypothetical protein
MVPMKNKYFATYPIAFINDYRNECAAEEGKFFDTSNRQQYIRSLQTAQDNLLRVFGGKKLK